jgi:tetratricopeptide (TPR) repeat protein
MDRSVSAPGPSEAVAEIPLATLRILHGGSESLAPGLADATGDSVQIEQDRKTLAACRRARQWYFDAIEHLTKGRPTQAITLLKQAADLCPNTLIFRIHLSNHLLHYSQALAAAGRLEDAIAAARRSIESNPSEARGFYQLASLEAARDLATAVALLRRAIELNPHYLPAYLLKAEYELASGEPEEAGRTLGAALSVEPLNLKAYHLRALSFMERDMVDEARMEIERLLQADPDNLDAIDALAYVHLLEGDLDGAEDLYEDVLKHRPNHLGALNNYATILAEKGDYDGAVAIWTKALALDPGNRDIIDNITEARQKMRR